VFNSFASFGSCLISLCLIFNYKLLSAVDEQDTGTVCTAWRKKTVARRAIEWEDTRRSKYSRLVQRKRKRGLKYRFKSCWAEIEASLNTLSTLFVRYVYSTNASSKGKWETTSNMNVAIHWTFERYHSYAGSNDYRYTGEASIRTLNSDEADLYHTNEYVGNTYEANTNGCKDL
jgi:hypothetical protein